MNKSDSRVIILVFLVTLTPGLLALLYSQTLVVEGIGAVDYFWQPHDYGNEVRLNVSSAIPTAGMVIHGERLVIPSFNTSGKAVSIIVGSELNGTILDLPMISGDQIEGVTFPLGAPEGWVMEQDFNVTVQWEGTNTTLVFSYYTQLVGHADGVVTYIMPGFYEVQSLGLLLLGGGLVSFIVFVVVVKGLDSIHVPKDKS